MNPGEAASPAGTVTFLFTDIEGSTRLLQELGSAYSDLVARHHALVRGAIESGQGHVVDTAGDGFFAVFSRARDAVAGAVAIQRAMASAGWPHGRPPAVRIGLHTGEPALGAEGYVGLDVHRAARIGSAAAGGQILLSKTTRDLVGTDLPAGVTLRDLGSHRLKDLSESEHLFQLVVEGLRSDFPLPHSAGAVRVNFPVTATRLIARESEIDEVCGILRSSDTRVVTLTGPGGTGKTRLGLAVADAAANDFGNGAVFVPLASLTDASLVATTIARSLGLMEHAGRPTIDVLIAHLREQELLIMLDNFEQVVDASRIVARLLAECPRVRAIVTSRIVLRLTGEREYPVSPLPLPDATRDDSAIALRENPAVALFVERARAVRPDFDIDDENAPAIAELCVRLDGLPLALELAAARIRIFSPHALLSRLGNRLDLLRGGARDMPERHQTLRGAIAWSYELLDDQEQSLFRRLSAFIGGFTLEAAEAVCEAAGPLGLDVFDGLSALVERSLVQRLPDVHGEPRFGILETVREFGVECLEQSGEQPATSRAHADFFLAFAEAAAPRLTGPEQRGWLERLDADIDNLRAAFAVFGQSDAVSVLRLGAALYRFWVTRGHLREGRQRLEECLALPGAATASAARALALTSLGNITHELSQYTRALPLFEEALDIYRSIGDERGVANVATGLTWIRSMIGNHEAARATADDALEKNRRLGNRRGEALIEHNLGLIDFYVGHLARARSHFDRGIALMAELGDRRGQAYFGITLSWMDREEGRWSEAAQRIDDGLAVLTTLRDTQLIGWGLTQRALLALDMLQPDAAVRMLEQALVHWREVGNAFGLATALTHIGLAEIDRGEATRADRVSREAITAWTDTGSRRGRATGLAAHGEVLTLAGQIAHAAAPLSEALRILHELGELPVLRRTLDAAALALEPLDAALAARLLGASDRLMQRLGVVRPPRVVRYVDSLRTRLAKALGEPAFEEALSAGASLGIDDIVSLAIGVLDSAISEAPSR